MVLVGIYLAEPENPLHFLKSRGEPVTIDLKRGPFTIYYFQAREVPPKAEIIFGSGDGGWSSWEETVSRALQASGYSVTGIDSVNYARTDYDLSVLQSDFGEIARKSIELARTSSPRLIVGGWSMGAAQAIAVAGGPHPPEHLVGLLVAAPLSRGRFGLRISDQMNVLPVGPGTFAVKDFAPGMDGLRVVQWHAAMDNIDSRAWLADLKAPHQEHDLPDAGHNYADASQAFLQQLVNSVTWILDSTSSTQPHADDRPALP